LEAYQLNKKYMILPLLLVFLFAAGLSQGQPANNTSTNETIANATQAGHGPNLNYIWSFSGIEINPITMVLNQEGGDLYGQAKYEPEGGKAWNADVVGSITENEVELTLTVSKDKELITTKMTGTYANDTVNGNFTQISGGKKVGSGTFSAMWINPDTSSYTPAIINEPKVETPAPAVVNTTAASNASSEKTTPEAKSKRFTDVHEYADKIGPGGDMSGVPPGMGGSGGLSG
jgi:hypothetical protein